MLGMDKIISFDHLYFNKLYCVINYITMDIDLAIFVSYMWFDNIIINIVIMFSHPCFRSSLVIITAY